MEHFPYDARAGQDDLVAFLRAAAQGGFDAIAESATGTGKTICALTAVLPEAARSGKRVVYLVRTNSQEQQVMREFRALRGKNPGLGPAVAIQGRVHMCPRRGEDPTFAAANAEELGRLCRASCRAADAVRAGDAPRAAPCRFYSALDAQRMGALTAQLAADALTAEELVDVATNEGVCPYLVARQGLPDAQLVVAPYVYILHPGLRATFLKSLNTRIQDLIIVVDEAHNVPDFARELASAELSLTTLERAEEEAREHGDPALDGSIRLSSFLDLLGRLVLDVARSSLPADADGMDDALLARDRLATELLGVLGWSTVRLAHAVETLEAFAESVRSARLTSGRLPRSHVGAIAHFLELAFADHEPDAYAHLVERGAHGEPRLAIRALDASVLTQVFARSHASVHVSGTLEPLDEYRDAIGLDPSTPLSRVPSPFPVANRLVVADGEVTTRFADLRRDPSMWVALRARIAAIRAATDRNIVLFAPSREILGRLAPALGPDAVVDSAGLDQRALMAAVERFREMRGGSLASVIGGRVAEGLDFPGAELEVVIIAGLPYPKPTARLKALERFYARRFGRGWEYAVRAPMVRRVLQAAGRLIRTPEDRGVVIILDKRARVFQGELPGLTVTGSPDVCVADFFNGAPPAFEGYSGFRVAALEEPSGR